MGAVAAICAAYCNRFWPELLADEPGWRQVQCSDKNDSRKRAVRLAGPCCRPERTAAGVTHQAEQGQSCVAKLSRPALVDVSPIAQCVLDLAERPGDVDVRGIFAKQVFTHLNEGALVIQDLDDVVDVVQACTVAKCNSSLPFCVETDSYRSRYAHCNQTLLSVGKITSG